MFWKKRTTPTTKSREAEQEELVRELFRAMEMPLAEEDPVASLPPEVLALVEQRRLALGDRDFPPPGTASHAVAQRFDRKIKVAMEKHRGEAKGLAR